jgi:hypothetical protein
VRKGCLFIAKTYSNLKNNISRLEGVIWIIVGPFANGGLAKGSKYDYNFGSSFRAYST